MLIFILFFPLETIFANADGRIVETRFACPSHQRMKSVAKLHFGSFGDIERCVKICKDALYSIGLLQLAQEFWSFLGV